MSGLYSGTANYGGRQPDNTAYIKQFVNSTSAYANWVYKKIEGIKYLTPATKDNVYIPKDLVVSGSIISPSDRALKQNIQDLTDDFCDQLLLVSPKQYTYIYDENQKARYGVIAQDIELLFPELVSGNGVKSVNYLELIPIMIVKMKKMQVEIDKLSQQQQQEVGKNV